MSNGNSSDSKWGNKKILIVDDEPFILAILNKMITKAGYEVFEAPSGNKAFDQVKKVEFDLVITDERMPDGTGFELLKKIKDFDEKLPVIVHTGFTKIDEELFFEHGVAEILHKPAGMDKIISSIEKHMACGELLQTGS